MRIDGIGTTTLTVHGRPEIDVDVDYAPSEDPIEAMSLLAAAIVTGSEITIRRVPIEFLEIELALLEEMGFDYEPQRGVPRRERPDPAGRPDHQVSELHAPIDKIHPMPFPGLNIDNLPFFAVIAASPRARRCCTTGSTRTARSTSPSSTSSAPRSSCSTRTG